MATAFTYELIKSGKIVGFHTSFTRLTGLFVVILEVTMFKQKYNAKVREIKIPIKYRTVYDDGVEVRVRTYLDVTKKSQRQIELIRTS